MNRRQILVLGTAATALGQSLVAQAQTQAEAAGGQGAAMPNGHEHHGAGARYTALVAATSACISAGDACLTHCLVMLGEGDKELALCAKTVRDTIAACTALRELAAANSPHVQDLARVVAGICGDCEAECKKHGQHPECRDCEKACRECRQLCERVSLAA